MRYRKKPVEIEARRYEPHARNDWKQAAALGQWCGGTFYPGSPSGPIGDGYPYIAIETLEGTMKASPGDWIIRGIQGEFYPVKPDIFEATYEPIGGDQ